MRWLFVALLCPLALLASERAEASGCFLGPYSITIDPPQGCDVVIVSHAVSGPTTFSVTARRGQQDIDVTGAVAMSTTMLDVEYTNFACDGGIIQTYTQAEAYNVYRIALANTEVGDHLLIEGIDSGRVQASGTCTENMTMATPQCTAVNSGYPCSEGGDAGLDTEDEGEPTNGGCSTGRGSAGIALAMFLLLIRRRTRSSALPTT